MLRKMKPYLVSRILHLVKTLSLPLLSALLLIFSFPLSDFWILAWVGFIPLFFALRNQSKIKAFLLGYLTGAIFWSGVVYWLVHVTLPGTITLILYLALYFGIFGLIVSTYNLRLTTYNLIFIPSLWVILEYIRGYLFTGFPWALLGYSQYRNLAAIQIADITGVWGVSFLVMLVNLAIFQVLGSKFQVLGNLRKYFVVIILLLITLIYGYFRLYLVPNTQNLKPIYVSVIQGNIPQELKWHPKARPYIIDQYARLTRKAAEKKPDLIIWPEASSPGILGRDNRIFEEISSLSRNSKIPLLLGTVTQDKEEYFNSAILLDGEGRIARRYDKLHLVPFGEYIPLKKFLPFLESVVPIGDINRGKEYTIFELPLNTYDLRHKFAVLICFEDLFPELSRRFTKRGAGFLVNITNDAWYKMTSAADQHLQASVFRAVENRTFVIRSANTGVSGFIGPSGRIISLVQDAFGNHIFVEGFDIQNVHVLTRKSSFYTRYGDVFVGFCFLIVLCVIILTRKKLLGRS
ncbi:MAG: apolipoprotein N-acyltransferase [Candidatus Omnitrophota bacterium]